MADARDEISRSLVAGTRSALVGAGCIQNVPLRFHTCPVVKKQVGRKRADRERNENVQRRSTVRASFGHRLNISTATYGAASRRIQGRRIQGTRALTRIAPPRSRLTFDAPAL